MTLFAKIGLAVVSGTMLLVAVIVQLRDPTSEGHPYIAMASIPIIALLFFRRWRMRKQRSD